MPTWLSDPSNEFYLVLFVAVVVTAMLWLRNRTRSSLILAIVALGLLLLFGLFDLLFESSREGAVRTVKELSAAINERNWDRFQGCLSDGFTYKGYDKKHFSDKARDAITPLNVRSSAWDLKAPDDLRSTSPDEFLLQFDGKAESGGKPYMAHFVATFIKERDSRWRLKTFTAYDYIQKRQPIEIPHL